MDDIDWTQPVTLHERDDGGSDLYFEFRKVHEGPLAQVVGHVAAMTVAERARLVIDLGAQGTIAVADIMALANRPDFPAGGATS